MDGGIRMSRNLIFVCAVLLLAVISVGCGIAGPQGKIFIDSGASASQMAEWRVFFVSPDDDADLNALGRAVCRVLEADGYQVITSLDDGLPDVFVTYGYKTQGWRETSTTPTYLHSYKGATWTTGGYKLTSHYTNVEVNVGFITLEELRRRGGDMRLAERAWEGTIKARIPGQSFSIADQAPVLVENVLAEYPFGSGMPLTRPLAMIRGEGVK